MSSKRVVLTDLRLLIIIFFLGLFLRLVFIPSGGLNFFYDQGRDFYIIGQLIHGDLKLMGPPASVTGFYHGVLYYYFAAPFYILGKGDPRFVAAALALVNCLGTILTYFFSRKLGIGRKISLILSLLYAVSFEQTQYATWLSNPSLAVFLVPLYYYSLITWIKNETRAPWLAGIALGLAVQSELFLLYHLLIFLILFISRILKPSVTSLIRFFGILIIILLPMAVAQIKFGFPFLTGLKNLFGSGQSPQMWAFLNIYFDYFAKLFAYNIFPLNIPYAGLFGIGLTIWVILSRFSSSGNKVLVVYLVSSVLALPFGGSNNSFVNVGLGMAVYLMLGLFLDFLVKKYRFLPYLIITGILAVNLFYVLNLNPGGNTLFAIQPSLNLKNERLVMDYIYNTQAGRPFSVNTITAPLYINTAWSYLFNWYGKSHYNYLPFWHGHDQVGVLGNNLARPPKNVGDYYLIIDPPVPNFVRFIEPGIMEENGSSKLLEEKKFGEIRVQRRQKI